MKIKSGILGSLILLTLALAYGQGVGDTVTADYMLTRGDEISIKVVYNPEFNDELVIRPDGKIAFPFIGEVQAAGLTAGQLAQMIEDKLANELRRPQVIVNVRKFTPLKIYVGGEVHNPGVYTYTDKLTVLQAIAQAGNFKNSAQKKNIMIISQKPDNKTEVRKIDLKQLLLSQDQSEDQLVKPLDIVYVPEKFIAKANTFVEQYVSKLVPIAFVMGLNYSIGQVKSNVVPVTR